MSHTVTISIELRDRIALAAAVLSMKGTVLGEGTHQGYQGMGMNNREAGFGFNLPGWRFPLVLRAEDNTLAFDDYNGSWGNRADIDTLKGLYAVQVARQKVTELGWQSEIQADGKLLIYHPDGGTFTVSETGVLDATGFIGKTCDVAAVIENAMGTVSERVNKVEYEEIEIHILEDE